ncbi:MAG: hypothetical protein ACOY0T_38280 [Myxococcota bacterium]
MYKSLRVVVLLGMAACSAYACSVDSEGKGAAGGAGGASAGGNSGAGGKSSNGGVAGSGAGGARGGSTAQGGSAGDSSAGSAGEIANGGVDSGSAGAAGAGEGGSGGDASSGGSSSGGVAGAAAGGTAGNAGNAGNVGTGGAANDPCAPNPCLNGGTCKAGAGASYACTCSKRFVGARCDVPKFTVLNMWVTALSHDGKVVVGQACSGNYVNCPPVKGSTEGGAVTPLSLPTGLPTGVTASDGCVPTAVNGDGSWIGGHCMTSGGASQYGGVEWANSTAGKYMPGRNANEYIIEVNGASVDGNIVVGTLQSISNSSGWGVEQMFRRIPTSGIVPIVPLSPDTRALATGVSNDGLTVIGMSQGYAVRWSPNSFMSSLPELTNKPPDSQSGYRPFDISADGSVIVGAYQTRGGPTAVRWTNAGAQSLGFGTAYGVNRDGSLVVGGSPTGACAWDSTGNVLGLLDLIDDPEGTKGWDLWNAIAISDDGKVIVGNGVKDNNYWGWVARLP